MPGLWPSKDRAAGAPAEEIEVTPEMIEAGEAVAREIGSDEWALLLQSRVPDRVREILANIYRSMRTARSGN
jgi:propanediol dehydratase small subunit